MPIEYMTVPQVAIACDVTPGRVHQFISEGRLKAERLGERYVISREEVERFRSIPRASGRPNIRENAR